MTAVIIVKVVCGILASVLGVFLGVSFAPGLREKFCFLKWPDGTRKLWLFLLFVVCTASYLVLSEIKPSPAYENPVVLSSERIDLGSGTKKAINNFLVRNTEEIDLYQVTIKLRLNSTVLSVTNDDIRVEMLDMPSSAEMPIPISDDPFNQALVAFHGSVIPGRDITDHEALWIIIDHLSPKQSAGFRIRNQSFKVLPPGEHCLLASVSFYTNTLPATFMFDDGSPGFIWPRSDLMGMKSIGGKGSMRTSVHSVQIDGVDIVCNATRLIQDGKWDEAERELTRAIQQNPSLGIAYDDRACVLMRNGKIQDAYQDSVKALQLLPDYPLAHAHVAQCLRLLGRLDEALTNYNRAIVLAGTTMPSLIYERGAVLSDLNRPVEARRDFDQAILLGYTNELVRCYKGIAFLKENAFSNSIAELNVAITMRPDMPEARFARGLAFGALNQFGMADRDLKEAIRLRPSYAETLKEMSKANQVPEDMARKLADPQH